MSDGVECDRNSNRVRRVGRYTRIRCGLGSAQSRFAIVRLFKLDCNGGSSNVLRCNGLVKVGQRRGSGLCSWCGRRRTLRR